MELGWVSEINHIQFFLKDQNASYYVEVSVDGNKWDRVVDHSTHWCRAWQYLYFPTRTVRHIRFVVIFGVIMRVTYIFLLFNRNSYSVC